MEFQDLHSLPALTLEDFSISRGDLDLESLPPTPCTNTATPRRSYADEISSDAFLAFMNIPAGDELLLDDLLNACEPQPKRARLAEGIVSTPGDVMTVIAPITPSTPTSEGSSEPSPITSPMRPFELVTPEELSQRAVETTSDVETELSSPTGDASGAEEAPADSACDDEDKPKQGRRTTLPWSTEEDRLLLQAVEELGPKRWSAVASCVGTRSGKQCRLRWCNQIDPTIKREAWSEEEDMIIVRERTQSAPTPWVAIAALLQGRPDNAIKNRWNSTLRRRHAPA